MPQSEIRDRLAELELQKLEFVFYEQENEGEDADQENEGEDADQEMEEYNDLLAEIEHLKSQLI